MLDSSAMKRLQELLGDDPAEFMDLYATFLDEGPVLVRAIRNAAAGSDIDALRQTAHSLKSSARDIGATALADICASIETTTRAGALPDGSVTAAVEGAWAVLEQHLKSEIDRLGSH